MKFIREVFSEPDGKGSLSRTLVALAVIASIGWLTYLVIKEAKLPDSMANLAIYLGSVIGPLYTGNKIADAIKG